MSHDHLHCTYLYFRIIEIIFGRGTGQMKVVQGTKDHRHTITKDQQDNTIDQLVKIQIHVTIPRNITGRTRVLRTLLKMNGIH